MVLLFLLLEESVLIFLDFLPMRALTAFSFSALFSAFLPERGAALGLPSLAAARRLAVAFSALVLAMA